MEAKDWNESLLESGLKPDYKMVLSPDEEEDEHLAEQSFLQMNKFNFNQNKKNKFTIPNQLEKTWIDSDDDDEEFNDAHKEEQEDVRKN